MNEIIKVNEETMTVSARDLHEALGVASRFSRWFDDNKSLFIEGEDYNKRTSGTVVGNGAFRAIDDYDLTVLMAKHIALMSRTEKGKEVRNYLIDIERKWNSPEQVMARALRIADQTIASLKNRNKMLSGEILSLTSKVEEMQPKASYYDEILRSPNTILTTQIANDYGMSAKKFNQILKNLNIQHKSREQWVLYAKYQGNGYTKSVTVGYDNKKGGIGSRMQTEWTQKGRLFLYDTLKQNGIYPLMELDNQ